MEMDNKTVEDRMIASIIVGSQAYGTNLPESDSDEGGVCIPIKECYIGDKKFDQANKWTDANGEKIDKTVYSIDKAIDLMLDNNPNMLDYLYIPERCIKFIKPEWERILAIRDEFISKKCRYSFSGYAQNQMQRIATHKSYLLNPIRMPTREEFQLPEKHVFPDTQYETIAKLAADYVPVELKDEFYREMSTVVDNEAVTIFRKYVEPSLVQLVMGEFKKGQQEFLGMISSISGMYLKDEYTVMAKRELSYLSAFWNWKRYEEWKKSRNPKRQELERKCGYDSKHASHAIRLSRMCVEIMEGKGVRVDRKGIDADYLLDVRLGNRPFDEVLDESIRLEARAKELYDTSPIPYHPNRKLVNSIKMDIIEKYVFDKK